MDADDKMLTKMKKQTMKARTGKKIKEKRDTQKGGGGERKTHERQKPPIWSSGLINSAKTINHNSSHSINTVRFITEKIPRSLSTIFSSLIFPFALFSYYIVSAVNDSTVNINCNITG